MPEPGLTARCYPGFCCAPRFNQEVRVADNPADVLAPVLQMVDATIGRLAKSKFTNDPIVKLRYSSITSIVSSAYKRHGKIIEQALKATLQSAPHLSVWDDPKFCVSEAAERLASAETTALGATLPYGHGTEVRTLQVDLLVYNRTSRRLGAYESKRGAGYHDSGKIRSMLRDMRCLRMLTRSYGELMGLDVGQTDARMIFYYGSCSIGEPWSLKGTDLDAHFNFPVQQGVERVNSYFRDSLDALLATV
jgi:hypothetical protein